MPYVLTAGSTVKCAHGGTVVLQSSQTKLTVDDEPALLATDLINAAIPDCPVKPAPGVKPCTLVVSVLAGQAAALAIDDTAVLLDTAMGLTDGSPQPAQWSVASAGQTKLEAS